MIIKVYHIITPFLASFIFSYNQLSIQQYDINFDCKSSINEKLAPPLGTHKCIISLSEACGCDANVKISCHSFELKNINLDTVQNEVIYANDRYDNELEVTITPINSNSKAKTNAQWR